MYVYLIPNDIQLGMQPRPLSMGMHTKLDVGSVEVVTHAARSDSNIRRLVPTETPSDCIATATVVSNDRIGLTGTQISMARSIVPHYERTSLLSRMILMMILAPSSGKPDGPIIIDKYALCK